MYTKFFFCAIRIRSKTLVEIEYSHVVLSYVPEYDKIELIETNNVAIVISVLLINYIMSS